MTFNFHQSYFWFWLCLHYIAVTNVIYGENTTELIHSGLHNSPAPLVKVS